MPPDLCCKLFKRTKPTPITTLQLPLPLPYTRVISNDNEVKPYISIEEYKDENLIPIKNGPTGPINPDYLKRKNTNN